MLREGSSLLFLIVKKSDIFKAVGFAASRAIQALESITTPTTMPRAYLKELWPNNEPSQSDPERRSLSSAAGFAPSQTPLHN